jgi:hypothetical protein
MMQKTVSKLPTLSFEFSELSGTETQDMYRNNAV